MDRWKAWCVSDEKTAERKKGESAACVACAQANTFSYVEITQEKRGEFMWMTRKERRKTGSHKRDAGRVKRFISAVRTMLKLSRKT